jgi:hypothetical protein
MTLNLSHCFSYFQPYQTPLSSMLCNFAATHYFQNLMVSKPEFPHCGKCFNWGSYILIDRHNSSHLWFPMRIDFSRSHRFHTRCFLNCLCAVLSC